MRPRYLFDSHALLALFQKEAGAEVVAGILRKAISQDQDRLICVINLGEILYLSFVSASQSDRLLDASSSTCYYTCKKSGG